MRLYTKRTKKRKKRERVARRFIIHLLYRTIHIHTQHRTWKRQNKFITLPHITIKSNVQSVNPNINWRMSLNTYLLIQISIPISMLHIINIPSNQIIRPFNKTQTLRLLFHMVAHFISLHIMAHSIC